MRSTHLHLLTMMLCALLWGCAHAQNASSTAPRSLDETPAEALFRRGQQLSRAGEHVAAEQFLLAARKRGYEEHAVTRELVHACISANRLDSALHHALPYLERNPDDYRLRLVVATIYLASGDGTSARIELDQVIGDHPDVPDAHYFMGVVLRDEYRDSENARVFFENYLHLSPNGEHAAEVRGFLRKQSRVVATSALVESAP